MALKYEATLPIQGEIPSYRVWIMSLQPSSIPLANRISVLLSALFTSNFHLVPGLGSCQQL